LKEEGSTDKFRNGENEWGDNFTLIFARAAGRVKRR
jgi:hypothetical protein